MKKLLTLCLLAMVGSGLMAQENPSTEELSTLQQKVFFYYVYTDLNEASKQVLEEKAALLLKYPTLKLQINGYSCSIR
jgi:outer membrane protein OmpA-like peptidoglycan-associated protein